jgi:hypothetical protein
VEAAAVDHQEAAAPLQVGALDEGAQGLAGAAGVQSMQVQGNPSTSSVVGALARLRTTWQADPG